MNIVQRCRMFALGALLWIINAAMTIDHLIPDRSLASMHAGIAGLIASAAFMPRTMLHWP
jgi:hypothetical protein